MDTKPLHVQDTEPQLVTSFRQGTVGKSCHWMLLKSCISFLYLVVPQAAFAPRSTFEWPVTFPLS